MTRAAVGLAAAAAALAVAALGRQLAAHRPGMLRTVFAGVAVVAALICLAAASREPTPMAGMLAALGVTLAVCAAVALT
jgi:hypothetical protein